MAVNTSTGLITGIPTASGTSNVTLSAVNASGTGSATLVLTVNPIVDSNLSQGHTATASSSLGGNVPSLAVDGNAGSRWESVQNDDPLWIYIDLGQVQTIHTINLTWEGAAGKNYTLDVSNDVTNWN